MIVQVRNKDRLITKADVDVEAMTPINFAATVIEGLLTTGERFRCWTTNSQWAAFMA